jgi:hypothetical protein
MNSNFIGGFSAETDGGEGGFSLANIKTRTEPNDAIEF